MNPFLIAEIDQFAPDCRTDKNYYKKISNGEFPDKDPITSEGACYARSEKIQKTKDIVDDPYDENDPEPYYPYLKIAQDRIKKVWGKRRPECYWDSKNKTCRNYVSYRTNPFVRRENSSKYKKRLLRKLVNSFSFHSKSSKDDSNYSNSDDSDSNDSSDDEDDDEFYDARDY